MNIWAGLLALGGGWMAAAVFIAGMQYRVRVVTAFSALADELIRYIEAGLPAGQALQRCLRKDGELNGFIAKLKDRLDKRECPFAQAWRETAGNMIGLTATDIECLKETGTVLAQAQSAADAQYLAHRAQIEALIQQARLARNKNARLYRSLGVLCGLMVAVAVL